jgi:hypothetical protein
LLHSESEVPGGPAESDRSLRDQHLLLIPGWWHSLRVALYLPFGSIRLLWSKTRSTSLSRRRRYRLGACHRTVRHQSRLEEVYKDMSQTFVFRARHAEQADFMRFALSFVTLVRPGWHVFDQRSDFAKVFAGFSRT